MGYLQPRLQRGPLVNINKYRPTRAYSQVDSGGRGDKFEFGAEKRGEEICKKIEEINVIKYLSRNLIVLENDILKKVIDTSIIIIFKNVTYTFIASFLLFLYKMRLVSYE